MYNPSRGGVRGGADQFTWDSVKTDKHRENYLGHSVMASVGRWQKGKDLSWYAKERKDAGQTQRSEMAAIKQAEQEAMLIALGQNVVRKTDQALTKEEMQEALKRNVGSRDELNIDRIDGVGSGRTALLSGAVRTSNKNEGVVFESQRVRNTAIQGNEETADTKSKHKKSKKNKKDRKRKCDRSSSEERDRESVRKHQKKSRVHASDDEKPFPKKKSKKKSKHRIRSSSISDNDNHKSSKHKSSGKPRTKQSKRQRHDTSSGSD